MADFGMRNHLDMGLPASTVTLANMPARNRCSGLAISACTRMVWLSGSTFESMALISPSNVAVLDRYPPWLPLSGCGRQHRQGLLRQGEGHIHVIQGLQGHDHGADRQVLAQVHVADAGVAGEGRADGFLGDVRLGVGHVGLGLLQVAVGRVHVGLGDQVLGEDVMGSAGRSALPASPEPGSPATARARCCHPAAPATGLSPLPGPNRS